MLFPVWRGALENISDPEGKAYRTDGVGEGKIGLAIPCCGIGGLVTLSRSQAHSEIRL